MLGWNSCKHHPSLEAVSLVQSHKQWEGSHRCRHFRIGGENTEICIFWKIWGMSGTAVSLQDAYRDMLEMVETQLHSNDLGIGNLCISWTSAMRVTGKTQAGRSPSQPCAPQGTAHVPSCALHGLPEWSGSWAWAQLDHTSCRTEQMNFTVLLPSLPSHSCSAPPPAATGKSLGQQQAALSHGSHSRSSGHLGLSRGYYKISEKADASGWHKIYSKETNKILCNVAKKNGHFQVGNHFLIALVPQISQVMTEENLEFAIATSAYFGGSLKLESRPKAGAYPVPGLCLLHSRGVANSEAGELEYEKKSKVLWKMCRAVETSQFLYLHD